MCKLKRSGWGRIFDSKFTKRVRSGPDEDTFIEKCDVSLMILGVYRNRLRSDPESVLVFLPARAPAPNINQVKCHE